MNWITKLETWDQNIIVFLNSYHHPFLDQLMWVVTDHLFGVPFYILFLYFIYRNYNFKKTVLIVLIVGAIIGLGDFIAANLFKDVFQRYRPSHNLLINKYLHFYQFPNGEYYRGGMFGFVSNHATNIAAFCWAAFLLLKNNYSKCWIYLLLFLLLISYSRIYFGVHYVTDIIGGWLLGVGLVQSFHFFLKKYI